MGVDRMGMGGNRRDRHEEWVSSGMNRVRGINERCCYEIGYSNKASGANITS